MKNVVFVTGNPEKAKNFSLHMGEDIEHVAVDTDEIQTLSAEKLAEHKARQAFDAVKRPVLVEDVSFVMTAWDGLPGPFIKYYVQAKDGLANMIRMTEGFDDRTARASCVYVYFDGDQATFFHGGIDGLIAREPRGTNGYGFDMIFEPTGFEGKTAAELDNASYERYYTTIKPFAELRGFVSELE